MADDWRGKALRVLAAAALHALPLVLLVSALPLKPQDLGGAFGQSVSVSLVSGVPASTPPAPPQAAPRPPSLSKLEQRLSDHGLLAAEVATPARSSAPTRLSDLFDAPAEASGPAAAKGVPRPTLGGDDDPFARASVSYRGDDPQKAARLAQKARGCSRGLGSLRVLLIINSEGYLVARPRPLGTEIGARAQKAVNAIERCAPFPEAATPGPPRSYEVELG